MPEVTYFECGGDKCPKGGAHQWDGEGVDFKSPCRDCEELPEPNPDCKYCHGTGEYISGGAATCSKCGLDAMSHSLMSEG